MRTTIGVIGWIATSLAASAAEPRLSSPIEFRDVAAEAGVRFRFDAGSRGRHDLPAIMGGGVAILDADGDGWLDLYLCNGGPIGGATGRDDSPCRFYCNARDGTFEEATEAACAPGPSFAMGAAVGDYDGDGRDDLLVTGWRDQRLYRNAGGGRFLDVTERAGLTSRLWSTSAAFADFDRDGDLDLYVATYVDFDPATAPYCAAPDGRRDFCAPEDFEAQPDRLYRNEGDGHFTDVSGTSGIARADGRGLGVLVADLVGDSRLDVYVANDGGACRLFENRGGLRFEDVGLAAGVAFDGRGSPLAGMGIALGDLDGDGLSDLVVTNFLDRSTVAYQALGAGVYRDSSAALGISGATRGVLGFGVALADFDGDGRLDLLQANGHVQDRARLGVPFAMRPTLLQDRAGRLIDASATAGPAFLRTLLGRGLAVGDLDRDGRPDVVVNALDSYALVLRNVTSGGPWLTLELAGHRPGQAFGARVRATVAGRVCVREVIGGGSYLSASDRCVHLGLGDARRVDRLDVTWPSGLAESWHDLPAGGRIRLEEGTGAARP